MKAIFRREMSAYFTSPIGYIYLAVFNFFGGLLFVFACLNNQTTNMANLFSSMFWLILFLIPVLTMRLLSEDKKQKTDQCLLTSPTSLAGIVLGKYFAALAVFSMSLITLILFAIILSALSPVIWTVVIGNIVGFFLLGVAFLAVGLFISSLTESQLVAIIGGFVSILALWLIDFFVSFIPNATAKELISKLSFASKYEDFTLGIFNISSMIFFISVAVIFNFLTVRVLEKRRWG